MGMFSSKPARVMLLGLDSAGKSKLFFKLTHPDEDFETIPSAGFSVEDIKTPDGGVTLTIWDTGYHHEKLIRQFYYPGSEGVIFVIDSSDVTRIEEARKELYSVIKDEGMERGIPLVVLANKQDLPNALKSWELIEKLGLRDLSTNPWYIQEMCAISGEGLCEGVKKMADMVKAYRSGKRM